MAAAFSTEGSDIANVVSVFVASEVRGQGVSKNLLNDLISKIKKSGHIKTLHLEVNPAQLPAYNLYKNLGFQVTGKTKRLLGNGTEYEDLLMKLPF